MKKIFLVLLVLASSFCFGVSLSGRKAFLTEFQPYLLGPALDDSNIDMVKHLLEHKAVKIDEPFNEDGETLLHVCVQRISTWPRDENYATHYLRQHLFIKELLELGYSVEAKSLWGQTPIDFIDQEINSIVKKDHEKGPLRYTRNLLLRYKSYDPYEWAWMPGSFRVESSESK